MSLSSKQSEDHTKPDVDPEKQQEQQQATTTPDSSSEHGSNQEKAPPKHNFPEGGTRAWLAVLGCACVAFITFGYINAFGVYEDYYLAHQLRDSTPSNVAWIGSIQIFALFFGGLVSGPIVDNFGPRPLLLPCAIGLSLSIMFTSLCTEFYQFLLAQGIFGGLCQGLMFAPANAIVGHYFFVKRPAALGLASAGSALGGILFPIILDGLLNRSSIGFGWSVRVLGFLVLALALVACVTLRPGIPPRRGTYLIPAAFKNPAYTLQVIGLWFVFIGFLVPMFFLPSFAVAHGINRSLAWYLITILNGASFVGRIGFSLGSLKVGAFNTLSFLVTACATLTLAWAHMSSTGALIAFAILFGAVSGGTVGLLPSTIAHLAPSPQVIGTYIGMGMAVVGTAGLAGTPIAGAFIQQYGGFVEAGYFAGGMSMLGSILVIAARIIHEPKKLAA